MKTLAFIGCVIAIIAATGSATAKPTLTVVCEAPVGNRFDQFDGKITENKDSYTDVNPIFILDTQKPEKLLVVWGPTKGARDLGMETNAQEAIIVSRTNERITALLVDDTPGGGAEIFSLYPAKGLLLYSRHYYMPVRTGVPGSSMFQARCKYSSS